MGFAQTTSITGCIGTAEKRCSHKLCASVLFVLIAALMLNLRKEMHANQFPDHFSRDYFNDRRLCGDGSFEATKIVEIHENVVENDEIF